MRNSLFLMILILCLSCKNQKSKLVGREYIYDNTYRKFSIEIVDRENLIIKNVFNCTEMSDKFKSITLNKKYKVSKNRIIIKNPDTKEIEIPFYNDSNCTFLTEKFRTNINHLYDGRTFYPDESLYILPQIDTLNIINDSIYYFKKTKNGSIGFMFKNNKDK